MSYANGTTHYNLPQTVGTDKRDWFDTNQAFADIDEALYGAVQQSTSTATALTALTTRVGTAESDIATIQASQSTDEANISALQTLVNQHTSEIADVKADALDMICAVDEGTAQVASVAVSKGEYFRYNDVLYIAITAIAVGETIVPNTNCRATNVATELVQPEQQFTDYDVYVDGDGSATYSSKLNSLFALIDTSKLTANSKLVLDIPNVFKGTSLISFTSSILSAHFVAGGHIDEYNVKAASSTLTRFTFSDTSVVDKSSDAPASGAKIGIIY